MNPKNKVYQDYKFLWKNKVFLFLLVLFIVLNICDVAFTYYGTRYKGVQESNELFGSCINDGKNYGSVFVAKLSFIVLISLVIYFIFKHYSKILGYGLITLVNLHYLQAVLVWIILLT